MRAFAEFVMRGRMQATLGVAGSIAIPLLFWLGAAGGGFILLRRGLSDALSVLFWALLPALVWWLLGDPSILLVTVGTLVLAQVLRSTTSWVWVLFSSVVLGMVFIAILSTISRELVESLAGAARPMLPQLMKDLPADQIAAVQESLIPTLTGLIASFFQAASLLCLVLARYWQAALFNPGGFGQEFRAVRLPPALAIALLIGSLLAPALSVDAAPLAAICMVPLLFAGAGLGHGVIALKRLSGAWIFALYLAVLLFGNLICLLAVIDSLFDFRGRLARNQGSGPANGEG
jgi:hypothetical protein